MGHLIHIISYGFIGCFLCSLLSFVLIGSAYCSLLPVYYLVVLITIHTLCCFLYVDELIAAHVSATTCYFSLDNINLRSNPSVENIPRSSLA